MRLFHSIHTSIGEVPEQEWDRLTADDVELTMDRRLIGAYEATMAGQCRNFTIVIRDETGEAVGLACMCLFQVDVGHFPWIERLTARVSGFWPNFLKIGVLFCGLPIPSGQSHLRLAAHADRAAALAELDRAMRELARDHGARIMVVKEFSMDECREVQTLVDRGYLRGEIPARHTLAGEFGSFAGYLDAIKARYRSQINRSLKKFKETGLRVKQVRGPVDFPRVYTDEVHRLYEAAQARSKYPLELYPAQFMRELGRRFGDDASLTCIYQGERVVAFTLGLARFDLSQSLFGAGLQLADRRRRLLQPVLPRSGFRLAARREIGPSRTNGRSFQVAAGKPGGADVPVYSTNQSHHPLGDVDLLEMGAAENGTRGFESRFQVAGNDGPQAAVAPAGGLIRLGQGFRATCYATA